MADAPDYTLLSDVNVVGSVTLDVNVVGSVTINTNITGVESGVTFDVAITSSTVTLDVNITNASLDVNATIVSSDVTLDVNVTNASLTVNIGAPLTTDGNVATAIQESIQIDVNIAAQAVTLDVAIQSSAVTLDVNIASSAVTLDVSITNATVTLNVNVTNEVLQSKLAKPAPAFNEENSRVEIDESGDWLKTDTDDFTLIVWAKANITEKKVIIEEREGGSVFMFWNDGNFSMWDSAGNVIYDKYPDWPIDNGLHQYAVVVDNANKKVYHYRDGGDKTYTGDFTGTINNTTGVIWVGSDTVNPSARTFNGIITQVLIYNRALSADEIALNYNNPQSPITDGLVCWLNFDEGSGSTAYDKSGNGNHGTIYNCVWVSEQGQVAPLLNVNLTASQVTLNINVTAQDIDLKIYTPSGRWVTGSDLFAAKVTTGTLAPRGGEEDVILDVTGRGRIKQIGLWLDVTGVTEGWADCVNDAVLRVYLDDDVDAGTPTMEIYVYDIDLLNGREIYGRMEHEWYDDTVTIDSTSYERYYARHVSENGAVKLAIYDRSNLLWVMSFSWLVVNCEFLEKCRITLYNDNATSTNYLYGQATVLYGVYP